MSISTLGLYESLLKHDRPIAWWGLDTADPTEDDSGHGYTLTAAGAPANATGLIPRGDAGAAGCRDFNGSADAYWVNGTVKQTAESSPGFQTVIEAQDTGTASLSFPTPTIPAGDLLLALLVHPTNTATISSAPSGWTQVGSTLDFTAGAAALYKRTPSSEETPTLHTWTWSTTGDLVGCVLVYRGADPDVSGLIYDSGQQATSSGQFHATTSETFPEQARVVALWAGDFSGTIYPSTVGLNKRSELTQGTTKLVVADYAEAVSGSTSKSASTDSATQLGAFLVTFGSPKDVVWDRLDTMTGTASIHAVINPDTVAAGTRYICAKGTAPVYGLRLSAGTVQFVYYDGSSLQSVNGPSVSASTTTHLVVVDDGTDIHFYKDGAETTASRPNALAYSTSSEPAGDNRMTIGALWGGGSSFGSWFDGRIDEVAVWNSPLSDDMVAAYYEAYNAGTFGTALGSGLPRTRLEIAWASNPTDDCYVWDDVTSYVRHEAGVNIRRGRNFELDRMESGRMDFALDSRGREFVPGDSNSPFSPNVLPTKPVRFRAQATVDGVVHPRFFGTLEGWPLRRAQAAQDQIAVMTAVDKFKALSLDKLSGQTVRPKEFSGRRIQAVLDEVTGLQYDLDAGQSEIVGDNLEGVNRLDHCLQVAETDGGTFFTGSDGVLMFQDRHYRVINERTVRATYGDGGGAELPLRLQEPELDEARLFTAARVTPASGNVKTVEDSTAALAHYVRTKELTTLHASDNDAQAMAEAYAFRYATPRFIIPQVSVVPQVSATPLTVWETVLGHDISHRIKTVERVGGDESAVNREHFIEGVTERWKTRDVSIAFSVSPAELDGDYWLLGSGELGDATGLTATVLGW